MFTPAEIAKNFIGTGVKKAKLSVVDTLVLAMMAGIFIACGGIASTTAAVTVDSPSIAKLVSACIFPAGLIMVVICGSELFTGDNLVAIAWFAKKIKFYEVLRNWVLVLFGNFIGATIVSALVVYGHTPDLFGGQLAEAIVNTANAKCGLSFMEAFCRGIMCNILVCLGVWACAAAKDVVGKAFVAFWPILCFVVCGYEHSVANCYYIMAGFMTSAEYGIEASNLTVYNFLVTNLVPVTLGNIVGGAIFVGLSYWFVYLRNLKEDAE